MKKKNPSQIFSTVAGQILFVIFFLNFLNLVFELFQLTNFENFNFAFEHGYFLVNGIQVGINIFANLLAFVILVTIFSLYKLNEHKAKKI